MPQDAAQLIQNIRNKYPKEYGEMPDEDILSTVQKKYPGDYDDYRIPGYSLPGKNIPVIGSLATGIVSGIGSAVSGAGTLSSKLLSLGRQGTSEEQDIEKINEESWLSQTGKAISSIRPPTPYKSTVARYLLQDVPAGIGSMIPPIAIGGATALATGGMGAAATIAPIMTWMLQGGEDQYQRSIQEGRSPDQAWKDYQVGALASASNALPFIRAEKWLNSLTGGGLKKILAAGGIQAMEETAQEAAEQIANDYFTGRPIDWQAAEQAGGVGGGAGFVVGAIMQALLGKYAPKIHNSSKPDEAQAAAVNLATDLNKLAANLEKLKKNGVFPDVAPADTVIPDQQPVIRNLEPLPGTEAEEASPTPEVPPELVKLRGENAKLMKEFERVKAAPLTPPPIVTEPEPVIKEEVAPAPEPPIAPITPPPDVPLVEPVVKAPPVPVERQPFPEEIKTIEGYGDPKRYSDTELSVLINVGRGKVNAWLHRVKALPRGGKPRGKNTPDAQQLWDKINKELEFLSTYEREWEKRQDLKAGVRPAQEKEATRTLTPPPVEAPAPKEPWEMTREEVRGFKLPDVSRQMFGRRSFAPGEEVRLPVVKMKNPKRIYRATDVENSIFPGAMVFDSREEAVKYGDNFIGEGYKVIETLANPGELKIFTSPGAEGEYIYSPNLESWHKSEVERARASGKSVPPEVLAEYPELAKKEAPAPAAEVPLTKKAIPAVRYSKPSGVLNKLKDQKEYLLDKINDRLAGEPLDNPENKVDIKVPGDGEFSIPNTRVALEGFKKKVEKGFPAADVKGKKIPSISTKVTEGRLGEGEEGYDAVQYYNEFRPRSEGAIAGQGLNQYIDGYFTNGDYLVKRPDSKNKQGKAIPELIAAGKRKIDTNRLTQILDVGKDLSPATIVGEFKPLSSNVKDVLAHVVDSQGRSLLYIAKYIDSILSSHQDSKIFTNSGEVLVFKKGKEVVGLVGRLGETDRDGTESKTGIPSHLIPYRDRVREVMADKGLPVPPEFAIQEPAAIPVEEPKVSFGDSIRKAVADSPPGILEQYEWILATDPYTHTTVARERAIDLENILMNESQSHTGELGGRVTQVGSDNVGESVFEVERPYGKLVYDEKTRQITVVQKSNPDSDLGPPLVSGMAAGEIEWGKTRFYAGEELLYQNLMKNVSGRNIGRMVALETIQNSVDSFSPGQSNKSIVVSTSQISDEGDQITLVTIEDNGMGMSKGDVEEHLMGVGDKGKAGTTTAGGFGFAKAGFMLVPRNVVVTTTKDGYTTFVKANRDQLLNKKGKGLPDIGRMYVGKDVPSGTKFQLFFYADQKDAEKNNTYPLYKHEALDNFKDYAETGMYVDGVNVKIVHSWYQPGDQPIAETTSLSPESLPRTHPKRVVKQSGNTAEVHFIVDNEPPIKHYSGSGYTIRVVTLNKGLRLKSIGEDQYSIPKTTNPPPFKIFVNFRETAKVESINYPFIENRKEFGPAGKEIVSQISNLVELKVKELNREAYEREGKEFALMMKRSPDFNGVKVLIPFVDETEFNAAKALIESNAGVVSEMASLFKSFQAVLDKIGEKPINLVMTVDPKYHGWKSSEEATGYDLYAINPFAVTDKLAMDLKFIKAVLSGRDPNQMMAANMVHTLMHEYVHNHVPDHYEKYTMELADLYSRVTHGPLNRLDNQARKMYEQYRENLKSIQKDLSGYGKGGSRLRTYGYAVSTQPKQPDGHEIRQGVQGVGEGVLGEGGENLPAIPSIKAESDRIAAIDEKIKESNEKINKEFRGKAFTGLDPAIMGEMVRLMALHVQKGIYQFSDLADKVVAQLGERVRPYLRKAYRAVRNLMADTEHAKKMQPESEIWDSELVHKPARKEKEFATMSGKNFLFTVNGVRVEQLADIYEKKAEAFRKKGYEVPLEGLGENPREKIDRMYRMGDRFYPNDPTKRDSWKAIVDANEFLREYFGVRHDTDATVLAGLVNPMDILNKKMGIPLSQIEIKALRSFFAENSEIIRLAKKKGDFDSIQAIAYVDKVNAQVWGMLRTGSQEIGRALRELRFHADELVKLFAPNADQKARAQIHKNLERLTKGTNINIYDLARELDKIPEGPLRNQHIFNRVWNAQNASKKLQRWGHWYIYTNMLSSIFSHSRNIVGTASQVAFTYASDPIAVGLGKMTGNKDVTWGEISPYLQSRAAWAGIKEGLRQAATAMKYGMTSEQIRNLDIPNEVPGGLALNFITRALVSQDIFFRYILSNKLSYQLSYSKAIQDGKQGGAVYDRMLEILDNMPDDMKDQIDTISMENVFRGEMGKFAEWMSKGRDIADEYTGGMAGRLVMPFLQTVSNVTKMIIQTTPAGVLFKDQRAFLRAWKDGDESTRVQQYAMARTLLGSLLLTSVMLMVESGAIEIAGNPPWEKKEREKFFATKQPNSFRIPLISNKWFEYQYFGALGPAMSLIASIKANVKADPSTWYTAIMDMSRSILSSSFLSGVSMLTGAINEPDRKGEEFFGSLASTFTPLSGFQRNIATFAQPIKDTSNWKQKWVVNTPMSWPFYDVNRIPPRINMAGDVLDRGDTIPLGFTRIKDPYIGPGAHELIRLSDAGFDVPVSVPDVTDRFKIPEIAQKKYGKENLTQQEKFNINQARAKMRMKAIEQLMSRPMYENWNDERRAEYIKDVIEKLDRRMNDQAKRQLISTGTIQNLLPPPTTGSPLQ